MEKPAGVTRCLVCNRVVTDPDSVERKIGTTCWSRLQSLRSKQLGRRRKGHKRKGKGKVSEWDQPGLPFENTIELRAKEGEDAGIPVSD